MVNLISSSIGLVSHVTMLPLTHRDRFPLSRRCRAALRTRQSQLRARMWWSYGAKPYPLTLTTTRRP
jgi:hypothetical protein